MPWVAGKQQLGHLAGLTQAEEDLLEEMVYQRGIFEGVHGLHHRLVDELGAANAPARADVADWLRKQPGAQIARVPRKDETVAPVLVPPRPLSRVFIDSMFMPRTTHNEPGSGWKVYRLISLYICGLSKYVHLKAIREGGAPQQFSSQVRDGLIEFRRRARIEANDPNLHIEAIRSDKGVEYQSLFEQWRAAEEAANPGFYSIAKSPGTRSAFNSVAEATIKAIRRLFHGRYRAVKMDWDARNVPPNRRRFDWVEHLSDVEKIWNTHYHHTIKTQPIKAIRPGVAPTYAEVAQRMYRKARRKYGNRAALDGAANPGFSASGTLAQGQLVRTKKWKDGGGTASLSWENLTNKTADNTFSKETFRISAIARGQGMRLTTYELNRMDGTAVPGKWSRSQLLPIPEETLQLIETDDDDDSTDDDEDDDPVEQRPRVNQAQARYKVGDRLHFSANYFAVGAFPRLTPPIQRDRVGTITQAPAAAAQFAVGRRLYYTVRFDGEAGAMLRPVSIRLPRNGQDGIDNDDDVTYSQA